MVYNIKNMRCEYPKNVMPRDIASRRYVVKGRQRNVVAAAAGQELLLQLCKLYRLSVRKRNPNI